MGRVKLADGRIVEAVEVDIVGPNSRAVDFPLSDGTTIRLRISVARVHRVKGEYNDVGEPIYNAQVEPPQFYLANVPPEYCAPVGPPPKGKRDRSPEVA